MFKKVLVSEDVDSISLSIKSILEELKIEEIQLAYSCDEASLKIKKAIIRNKPFDLLICDLSFIASPLSNHLSTGEELINFIKKIQPDIKIIVYSIEDKSYRIKSLFEKSGINAYVIKGRNSIPKLKQTIQEIFSTMNPIIDADISKRMNDRSIIEIDQYDISILKLMSKGHTLENISADFKKNKVKPNSSSTIEKKITNLKLHFKANNNVQLIAISKDLGLI